MTDMTTEQDNELDDDGNAKLSSHINPDVLQNISVSLSIEVGRAQIKIKDLMRLTQGSVVELDRIAGEPLDLLVNNTVVAQGEVVLVNDRYGIRLTRVVPSTDRLKTI
jgi:flagellar motor switch protein FliN/FliY